MKKLLLVLAILIFTTSFSTIDDDFCDGWEEGYKRGYCDDDTFCVEPVVPVCPVPDYDEETYQDGYDRGFKKGIKDAE